MLKSQYFVPLLIALCCTLSSTVVNAQEQGIEVIGKASVNAMPDVFMLTMQIKERGRLATKTKISVDNKSHLLSQQLAKLGIEAKHIDSSKITMYPVYENINRPKRQNYIKQKVDEGETIITELEYKYHEPQIDYFEVTRTFVVKLDKLSDYDRLLDTVTKLGVSNISPLQQGFSDKESAYQLALTKALASAKNKAESMAKQLGEKLGRLISLKESAYSSPTPYMAMSQESVSFKSQVSEKAVTAQVIAIFAIQQ